MIVLLLACAHFEDDTGVTAVADTSPPEPADGHWDVTTETTWSGDCVFDSDDDGFPATGDWVLDLRGDTLIVYPDFYSVHSCAYADMGATCVLLDDLVETSSWAITIDKRLELAFPDAATLEGQYSLSYACEGPGCNRDGAAQIGEAFTFPCTATAAVAGTLAD